MTAEGTFSSSFVTWSASTSLASVGSVRGEPGGRARLDLQEALGDLGLHADLLDRVDDCRWVAGAEHRLGGLRGDGGLGGPVEQLAAGGVGKRLRRLDRLDRLDGLRGLEGDGPVRHLGEARPPGDVEDGRLRQVLAHAAHDLDLERRVHRGEGVVEDQHTRMSHQRTRQRDALALAA